MFFTVRSMDTACGLKNCLGGVLLLPVLQLLVLGLQLRRRNRNDKHCGTCSAGARAAAPSSPSSFSRNSSRRSPVRPCRNAARLSTPSSVISFNARFSSCTDVRVYHSG